MNKKIKPIGAPDFKKRQVKKISTSLSIEITQGFYEIDFTPIGIHVIKNEGSRSLGKPWMTTIISRFKSNGGKQ